MLGGRKGQEGPSYAYKFQMNGDRQMGMKGIEVRLLVTFRGIENDVS